MKEEKLKRELMKHLDSSSMYFSSVDIKGKKKSNFSNIPVVNGNACSPVGFNSSVLTCIS